MKRYRYLSVALVALMILCFGVRAEKPLPPPPPPPPADEVLPPHPMPPGRGGERDADKSRASRGFGPSVWRAFSRLSEQERQDLLKLQVNDAETFRNKMRELGEALHKEEAARFAELMKLVERCRTESDETLKAELKAKIVGHVRDHYMDRLEDNKRQLEEMKRRTARLEEELRKREANAEEVIKARAEALIRGEHPPIPPKPGKERK